MDRYAGLPLRLDGLRIAFPDRDGARRLVLDVPEFALPGTAHVALCGPSGSGKTSLLNVLGGLARPERGRVRWGEVDAVALPAQVADRWRSETVGFVFQQFHLFPRLSALENVVVAARFRSFRVPVETAARARELLERIGVPHAKETGALSRGEMQRVAVVRALVHRPAVVLADEPTASLDRANADAVAGLLRELCRDTRATLFVATHDESLAASFDRRLRIVDGRLAFDPQPEGQAA